MSKTLKIILITAGAIVAVLVLAAAIFYLWPMRSAELQRADVAPLGYDQAIAKAAELNTTEAKNGVTANCRSALRTHGAKTAKTVVMFHGITACTDQFKVLSDTFFEAGYNVYIPRAPHHGTDDPKLHANVRTSELVEFANLSLNIGRGLGEEMGVAGLSGGGMLATWAAEYRPDVQRLLVLSPFYEPATSQAPKWQLPLLKKLYGLRILGDRFSGGDKDPSDPGFSYYALANYLILTENLRSQPDGLALKSITAVTSGSDKDIDLDLAKSIPQDIADANNLPLRFVHLPEAWNAGHDIVNPEKSVGVREHQDVLMPLYFDLYEGRERSL